MRCRALPQTRHTFSAALASATGAVAAAGDAADLKLKEVDPKCLQVL